MFKLKIKNVLLWIILCSLVSTGLFLGIINYKVDQVWGAHTENVNPERFEKPQHDLAIVNVNVLSPDGEHMRPNQTVFISQGIITSIQSQTSVSVDAKIVDGTGKYVIPGLIDSHVHLWQSPNDLLLYLANGVTHIREMNGSEAHLEWKTEVQAGRPGPDMFVATRRHNTSGLLKGIFDRWTAKINPVDNPDAIEPSVKAMMKQGYDAVKIYTQLENEHFRAFNDAATKFDAPLLGHVPVNMKLEEVWQSEMKELSHTEELVKALNRKFGGYNSETSEKFLQFVENNSKEIAASLLDNNMAVVSTLALMESISAQKSNVATALQTVELDYVNPGISESFHPSIRIMGWLPDVNIYRLPDDYPQQQLAGNQRYWRAYAQANQILLRAMKEAGVTVLAGTDANVPIMVPGFSLHNELLALTQSGFSEAQALRSATAVPAAWMKIKSGKVQPGYQADLLLLKANPLTNIKNTQTVEAVISNGRWHNRTELDAMLNAVKAANDNSRKL